MDLTISRPVKILVLVLVVAGVGGMASLSLLGKSSGAASAPPIPTAAQLRAQRAAAAHKTTTATTPAAKPATVPHATTPKPKPKPRALTAANGLPIALADALRAHRIVVVSVFDPESQTDAVTYAEARAGAADAGAGFLGVSALDDNVAGPLTAALPSGELLPVPGVLVFRRPGTLVQRVDGFADRDSIAALAAASVTAPAFTGPAAPAVTAAVTTTPAPAAVPTTTTP